MEPAWPLNKWQSKTTDWLAWIASQVPPSNWPAPGIYREEVMRLLKAHSMERRVERVFETWMASWMNLFPNAWVPRLERCFPKHRIPGITAPCFIGSDACKLEMVMIPPVNGPFHSPKSLTPSTLKNNASLQLTSACFDDFCGRG